MLNRVFGAAAAGLLLLLSSISFAGPSDWPMWRCDPARSASSPANLPDELHLLWVRQYSARTPVWDDPLNRDLMPYDTVFEPVISGRTLVLPFNDSGKISAIDTETGREKWSFYTGGPVRLPPAIWNGKVYCTSDDGCLYCLNLADGALAWKFSGAPAERRILGNSRLVSTWPARGGAVVRDGAVYFTAGIWPFMGVFIYALDAVSGKVLWVNEGEGARYMLQPHNAASFAGIAPQGALALAGNRLIVPGGRSVPACFDPKTGEYRYYELAGNNKAGGSFVAANDRIFFNHCRERMTTAYDLRDGLALVSSAGEQPVVEKNAVYFSGDRIRAFSLDRAGQTLPASGTGPKPDPKARAAGFGKEFRSGLLWEIEADATGDLIRAGNRLYAAGNGSITAVDIPAASGKPGIAWKKRVEGSIGRLAAADGKLFAVTRDGRVMAFGAARREPVNYSCLPVPSEPSGENLARARDILSAAGVRDGYSLVYGDTDGGLTEALAGSSDLRIIAVCGDRSRADTLRRRFDRTGLSGGKVEVFAGNISTFDTPQYLSSLTVLNAPAVSAGLPKETLGRLFQSLRPYGGALLLPWTAEMERTLADLLSGTGFPGAKLKKSGGFLLIVREGPLPGAGVWTHSLGNISNTAKSDDDRVRLPLGVLWFGGSSNLDVLPRHAHGPSEQVVGGRLFIEGVNCLNARDVYTGRVLWKTMLHDLDTYGVYYDETYRDTPTSIEYNQEHIPGANARGTNFVATGDRVYVIQRNGCHVLDPATGKTLSTFAFPPDTTKAKGYRPDWGYIGVYRDYLIAGREYVPFTGILAKGKKERAPSEEFDRVASRSLVVMDRFTGKTLWTIDSRIGFLHYGIVAGNGRLYVLDKYPPHIEDLYTRRGKAVPDSGRLLALDMATGAVLWERKRDVFGSFLGYSEANDLLIQSTRPSRDMVLGEDGKRMMALKGADQTVVWDRTVEYRTFPIIHRDRIITESGALNLLTGATVMRGDPLTGTETPWSWKREYGCNYPIASEHLLSFRSGAAGFYDLDRDSGTGNFGGFKSGCSASLIAADGVLNAPDYTRTCSCSYQNQTSLALVSMPANEMWTYSTLGKPKAPVLRLGVNFGAPGDRIAENGTLWLEYPPVGGPSPDVPVTVSPETARYHRKHSARLGGDGPSWVTASGCTGAQRITVALASPGARYTVRLFFAEPEEPSPGQRIFDVSLQGNPVLRGFDIAKEAGGSGKGVVKEFRNIRVEKDLVIELDPAGKAPAEISGVEVVREE